MTRKPCAHKSARKPRSARSTNSLLTKAIIEGLEQRTLLSGGTISGHVYQYANTATSSSATWNPPSSVAFNRIATPFQSNTPLDNILYYPTDNSLLISGQPPTPSATLTDQFLEISGSQQTPFSSHFFRYPDLPLDWGGIGSNSMVV